MAVGFIPERWVNMEKVKITESDVIYIVSEQSYAAKETKFHTL